MRDQPAFFIGAAVAGASFLLFMFVVFSSGGVAKSAQFRVLGELLAGRHGVAKRALTILAFGGLLVGSCSLFAGVSAHDRARAERCDVHCKALGNARGVIDSPRKPAPPAVSGAKPQPPRPACHCEGGSAEPSEMPADDVPRR
jgi:hypothetical protein